MLYVAHIELHSKSSSIEFEIFNVQYGLGWLAIITTLTTVTHTQCLNKSLSISQFAIASESSDELCTIVHADHAEVYDILTVSFTFLN